MLDKTAQRLEQSKGAKARFELTNFEGDTENGRTEGSIEMDGSRFHLSTPDMQTWFDGTTQWSMFEGSGEVNIQVPTEEELARMNPYAFIALYRSGFRMKMKKEVALRGTMTYEVTLTSKDSKSELQTIIVNIDRQTFDPLCIRMKSKTNWVRLSIRNLSLGHSFSPKDFAFPYAKYPNVEVIDLR
ncbi:MAG: hypothetical protein HUK01_03340 [Bacteroidaceae bacterium]|nr:hypothetical protein [Bacteroidaceae bacterium]